MDERSGDRKGGPRTEAGKRQALLNLRQFKTPSHGAYAVTPEDVQAQRDQITAMLEAELGSALRPADRATVQLLAVTIRRVELLEAYLTNKGMHDKNNALRPALGMLATFLKVAREYCADLGMSPAGRAKLGIKDRSKSLADLMADAASTLDKEAKN